MPVDRIESLRIACTCGTSISYQSHPGQHVDYSRALELAYAAGWRYFDHPDDVLIRHHDNVTFTVIDALCGACRVVLLAAHQIKKEKSGNVH